MNQPVKTSLIATGVLAALLEILDSSIVNVAVPDMTGNLGATLDNIGWVLTGYIIANAIILPIAPWLATRLGRRNYFTGAIVLFTLFSAACGLAPNLGFLILMRVLQGLAGGALLPTSQALIQEAFPPEQAAKGSAVFGVCVIIGPMLGPTLGGYLTDYYGWRSIFFINLPLGMIATALAYRYVKNVPVPEADRHAKMDTWGLVLLVLGLGGMQFVLERGQQDEWFYSNAIKIGVILAVVCLPLLIYRQLTIREPILNLRLFSNKAFRSGMILMLQLGFVLYSLIFFVPIFVTTVRGMSATQSGMLFIPMGVASMVMMVVAGALMPKLDPRILVFVGNLSLIATMWTMSHFSTSTGAPDLFWPLVGMGVGISFGFVPINTVVLAQFSGREMEQAAGLLNLFRQVGGSIGIALVNTYLDRFQKQAFIDLTSKVSPLSRATMEQFAVDQGAMVSRLSNTTGFNTGVNGPAKLLLLRIQSEGFVIAYIKCMFVVLVIYSLSLGATAFFKSEKKLSASVGMAA